MPSLQTSPFEEADEHWQKGQSLAVGRLIFESVPAEVRPKWAAGILKASLARSGISSHPIFDKVLDSADVEGDWGKAHDAFSKIRERTLQLESLSEQSEEGNLLLRNLYLAENVAKVIYNAANPPDAFDEDSGWWIAVCLKSILDSLNCEQSAIA